MFEEFSSTITIPSPAFTSFPKMSRLFRPIVITEKIDGTNAAVGITRDAPYGYGDQEIVGPGIVINVAAEYEEWEPVYVYAQSRKRIISPDDDNFGFARWVRENAIGLALGLGEGLHFGEWWGSGIQRGYGQDRKRFSLFNTSRWHRRVGTGVAPDCCDVVPILFEGEFNEDEVRNAVKSLETEGSYAASNFMNPEGVVTFHIHSNMCFKTTIKDDHKGQEHGA